MILAMKRMRGQKVTLLKEIENGNHVQMTINLCKSEIVFVGIVLKSIGLSLIEMEFTRVLISLLGVDAYSEVLQEIGSRNMHEKMDYVMLLLLRYRQCYMI